MSLLWGCNGDIFIEDSDGIDSEYIVDGDGVAIQYKTEMLGEISLSFDEPVECAAYDSAGKLEHTYSGKYNFILYASYSSMGLRYRVDFKVENVSFSIVSKEFGDLEIVNAINTSNDYFKIGLTIDYGYRKEETTVCIAPVSEGGDI